MSNSPDRYARLNKNNSLPYREERPTHILSVGSIVYYDFDSIVNQDLTQPVVERFSNSDTKFSVLPDFNTETPVSNMEEEEIIFDELTDEELKGLTFPDAQPQEPYAADLGIDNNLSSTETQEFSFPKTVANTVIDRRESEGLYGAIPTTTDLISQTFFNETLGPPREAEQTEVEYSVTIVEDFIGILGLFSKVSLMLDSGPIEFFVRRNQLTPIEGLEYSFLKPVEIPRIGYLQETDIIGWSDKKPFIVYYDERSELYYCSVEAEYDGLELTDEKIQKYVEDAYFTGLRLIFKSNAKKNSEDYIKQMSDRFYLFGYARDWAIKLRPCSNFYTLVVFPKKYLSSTDLIDYRADPLQAAKDGVTGGLLDPSVNPEDIKYIVTYSFLNYNSFAETIKDISKILASRGEEQFNFALKAADQYMGALTADNYLELIELDLRKEAKKFYDKDNVGNFLITIKKLLEINTIEHDVLYTDATKNNIAFGLTDQFNIAYIDIVRDGIAQTFVIDGYIFENEFGSYGVISNRSGFFLYNYCTYKIITDLATYEGEWNKELRNNLDIDKYIEKFVIPQPKEIDIPKRDFDCAKNNMKKLWEDGIIKGYNSIKAVAPVAEANFKKQLAYARGGKRRWIDFDAEADKQAASTPAATLPTTDPEPPTFGDDTLSAIKNAGYGDWSKPGPAALHLLKKTLRETNFQRALLQQIICWIRDANNQQALANLDSQFNSDLKKRIQEALTKFFCTPFMDMLIKALAAYKVPKFNPSDMSKALRDAYVTALSQAIIETFNIAIKELIKLMANCSKQGQGKNSPFTSDQELGLSAALDAILDNQDNPFSNSSIADIYGAMGLPTGNSDEDIQERERAKEDLKNLIADIACLMNPTEICRLIAEGTATDDILSLVRAIIEAKYPNISSVLKTRSEVEYLFQKLGQILNISDVCKKLGDQIAQENTNICSTESATKALKDALAQNGLTPEQIEGLIADAEDEKNKRLSDLLDGVTRTPEQLPMLCRNGKPGIINPAKVDTNYLDMFQGTLQGSLQPYYEMFNSDLKEWSANMIENPKISLTPEEIKTLSAASTSPLGGSNASNTKAAEENREKLLAMLIAKGILVADYVLDENGGIKYEDYEKKTGAKQKEINGVKQWKLSDDAFPKPKSNDQSQQSESNENKNNVDTSNMVISPILTQTLERVDFLEITKNLSEIIINTRVNSDIEREKFKILAEAQLNTGIQDEIKRIAAEKMGTIYYQITTELVNGGITLLEQWAAGTIEEDAGFWIGLQDLEKRYKGGWDGWWSTLLAGLWAIYELLDVFIADITGAVRTQGAQRVGIGDVSQISTVNRSIRTEAARAAPAGTRVAVAKRADSVYTVTSGDTIVATYDSSYASTIQSKGKTSAEVVVLENEKKAAIDKRAAYENYLNNPSDPNAKSAAERFGITETTQQGLDAAKQAEKTATANLDNAQRQDEFLIPENKLGTTELFAGIDSLAEGISRDIKLFEESFAFKAISGIWTTILDAISGLQSEVSTLDAQLEDARKQLASADIAFPNYDIKYTFGSVISPERARTSEFLSQVSNINITKNLNPFISSSYLEEISPDIAMYIKNNNLLAGYNGSSSIQQYAFEKYMTQIRKIDPKEINYSDIESEFMSDIYNDLKQSFFYKKPDNIGNTPYKNMSNLKKFQATLREPPGTNSDQFCGINNNSLDLDEIIEDVINDFREEACNNEPPNPTGGKRENMHPTERAMSDAFLLATLRVYIYDYFLKGIFLFDKYPIGIVATDPMLEFLSRCFEIEMKSFEPIYYQRFLDQCVSYFYKKNPTESKKIEIKTGERYDTLSARTKKEIFKKVIKSQILYISTRVTKKINNVINEKNAAPWQRLFVYGDETKKYESQYELQQFENYDNIQGHILKFFENRDPSEKIFTVVKNSSQTKVPVAGGRVIDTKGETLELYFKSKKILVTKSKFKKSITFKFLFEFCFPIRKYISVVTMQAIMANNARLQSMKTFFSTKAALKARHNSLMAGNGYKNNNDLGGAPANGGNSTANSGDQEAGWQSLLPLILRLAVQTPWQMLKGLCEVGDPNVFLASLPYNIARPITLAIMNQIPMLPEKTYGPDDLKPPPPRIYEEGALKGLPYAEDVMRRIGFNMSHGLFYATPAAGLALTFCFIPPTPFGLAYYLLGCWYDDFIDDTSNNETVNTTNAINFLNVKSNYKADSCNIARMAKKALKPKIELTEEQMIDLQYS